MSCNHLWQKNHINHHICLSKPISYCRSTIFRGIHSKLVVWRFLKKCIFYDKYNYRFLNMTKLVTKWVPDYDVSCSHMSTIKFCLYSYQTPACYHARLIMPAYGVFRVPDYQVIYHSQGWFFQQFHNRNMFNIYS